MGLDAKTYNLVVDCISIAQNDDKRKQLNQFEREFMDNQIGRHDEYGENMRLSDKQVNVLQKIYDKVVLGKDPFRK